MCVSPRAYRRAAFNASLSDTIEGGYARNARPLWFKAYNANSSDCVNVASYHNRRDPLCEPVSATLRVAAKPTETDVIWSMADRGAGGWGDTFATTDTTRPLDFDPATRWDHSNPRDYGYLDGGDQFRLVPEWYFAEAPNAVTSHGDVDLDAAGNPFKIHLMTAETS